MLIMKLKMDPEVDSQQFDKINITQIFSANISFDSSMYNVLDLYSLYYCYL